MANVAPYEVTVSGSDDETFVFTLPWEQTDGSAFPWSDYAIEYAVARNGCQQLLLTIGSGVTVDATAGTVTFKAARGAVPCGEYEHACRIRHLASGDETVVFAGPVTISEGPF